MEFPQWVGEKERSLRKAGRAGCIARSFRAEVDGEGSGRTRCYDYNDANFSPELPCLGC